jgi:hypothetical protein
MTAHSNGQYIEHFQYGRGVIMESDEQRTSSDFDLHEIKEFITSLIVADPTEGTPLKWRSRKSVKKLEAATFSAPIAGIQ